MHNTPEAARGKWTGILLQLGIKRSFLSGKHGPCPICEGKDRFRFDDKGGKGTFICSHCGAGTGFDLLQKLNGWDFKTAAAEVDKIVSNVVALPIREPMSEAKCRDALNRLWASGERITEGDPVTAYFAMRGLPMPANLNCLRYVAKCPVPGGGMLPAMIAAVSGPDGKPVTIHRTYLGPNGKADIDTPRALMPGELTDGSAIRLSGYDDRLGIAEGIETALAASAKFGIPVWAAVNATMLAKWEPPQGVEKVIVFGDNDRTFTGAAAAYNLAKRLTVQRKLTVDVAIPRARGSDWADEVAA